MRSWPGRTTGQGISATSVSPVLRLCRICFMGFVSEAQLLKSIREKTIDLSRNNASRKSRKTARPPYLFNGGKAVFETEWLKRVAIRSSPGYRHAISPPSATNHIAQQAH